MRKQSKSFLDKAYAGVLTLFALVYKFTFLPIVKGQSGEKPLRIVLLISRAQDVELLISLYDQAKQRNDLLVSFWMTKKCPKRFPDILTLLEEKGVVVDRFVSIRQPLMLSKELMQMDVFLSTVESTSSAHKFPYLFTKIANAAGISTYTLQHGFENIGLNYRDKFSGAEVKFAAKTVLTWGPPEELPSWVGQDTLDKLVAVGCPKKLVIPENSQAVNMGERPVISIFDNLHWHRYNEKYRLNFLQDLKIISEQRKEFHFILKSHPASIRNRGSELTDMLNRLENVDVPDLLGKEGAIFTTPWLLSHALGVITTPSTIAMDGALSKVPTAVTRYGLDLNYYSPLSLIDSLEDWHIFLNQLTEKSKYSQLKQKGELFLDRILVTGDPASKILDLMVEHRRNKTSPH